MLSRESFKRKPLRLFGRRVDAFEQELYASLAGLVFFGVYFAFFGQLLASALLGATPWVLVRGLQERNKNKYIRFRKTIPKHLLSKRYP